MKLTNRESQLLGAAAQGKTDREISQELQISRDTVSSHWRRILMKFQANSRTECVARYAAFQAHHLVDENAALATEVAERTAAQARELAQKNMLAAITTASLTYIQDNDLKASMDSLLIEVLSLTQSEYGFIGEVLYEDGVPFLQEHALTNIAWSNETKELYDLHHAKGLQFRNLKTLFGQVMVTKAAVIANNAPDDERRGGIPEGHPPLDAFLGLPVFHGEALIGMIGLANRPGGYSQALINYLEPLTVCCATYILVWRTKQEQVRTQQQYVETADLIKDLVDMIPSGLLYETPDRKVEFVNQTFIDMFNIPVPKEAVIGTSCLENAEQSKHIFKDPEGFLSRIDTLLMAGMTTRSDRLEFVNGQVFERDFLPMRSNGAIRGYLWCYRDISNTANRAA